MTGIGTDLVRIGRMEKSLARFGERLAQRILSEAERKLLADGAGKALFLAGRWAAKEAFAKALGTGFAHGMGPCDIEILRLPSGAPCIELKSKARELWLSAGAGRIHVSISHDTDYALAFVVIE